jgi:hypothetical protein
MGEERHQLDALLGALRPRAVFEWGSGGSTDYFPRRHAYVERWYSVEHDAVWFETVDGSIGDLRDRVKLRHVPPRSPFDRDDPAQWRESERVPCPMFGAYVDAIEGLDCVPFVLVDGRARNACLRKAAEVPGRVIVLHDAQRTTYRPTLLELGAVWLDGWTQGQLAIIRT